MECLEQLFLVNLFQHLRSSGIDRRHLEHVPAAQIGEYFGQSGNQRLHPDYRQNPLHCSVC